MIALDTVSITSIATKKKLNTIGMAIAASMRDCLRNMNTAINSKYNPTHTTPNSATVVRNLIGESAIACDTRLRSACNLTRISVNTPIGERMIAADLSGPDDMRAPFAWSDTIWHCFRTGPVTRLQLRMGQFEENIFKGMLSRRLFAKFGHRSQTHQPPVV